jgi:hypothetical protein
VSTAEKYDLVDEVSRSFGDFLSVDCLSLNCFDGGSLFVDDCFSTVANDDVRANGDA